MRIIICAAIALACTSLWAQTPPATPEFEVATVKPTVNDGRLFHLSQITQEVAQNSRRPGEIPIIAPDRIRLQGWSLLALIAAAYSVRTTQVSGPAWLSEQIFDIEAKVPDGSPKEQLNAMLQSLLEERFGLKVHRATKTAQGFALTVGKNGPNLKPAQPPAAPDPTLTPQERLAQLRQKAIADMAGHYDSLSSYSITIEELAAQLVRFAEAPVVDETGLTGKYSVTIRVSTSPDGSGDSVFDAVEKLGLKLERRKVTVEAEVVDQVSKTPTAN